MNSVDTDWTALRRTFAPYATMVIVMTAVSLFGVFVAVERRQWGILKALPFMWVLYSPIVYIGTRYRILWRADRIRQIASGKPDVVLSMSEIARVVSEVGATPGRPFRRLVLYPRHSADRNFIDISLKHFAAEDIRALLGAIHQARPDLHLPKH